jgi:acyl-coenzyme A synthetase/AMP-(fatty) acid ligase/acyl carrier protein
MQATPATWRLLLDSGWEGTAGLKVLCGGEALPRELANRLLKTGSEVWNLYGPTETTIWSAAHRLNSGTGPLPIGKPIANTQILVLDPHGNLVPSGVPGEIHIGGEGMARGYLHRPELTSERFVVNPFSPGKIMYRTGDLGRWLTDGNLECLGRTDTQVKLRGFRIELGEIESAMEQQPEVRQAVAVVREDVPGDQRLVAYVVMLNSTEDAKLIREGLQRRLPEYMVPSHFVFMDALPLTPNRKVDRKRLPAPDVRESTSAAYAPPRTETEIQVAEIWKELLKNSRVGINDNFFDLGGHSLLVVQLQTRLRRNFKQELSLIELFQYPTVSSIAQLLDVNKAKAQLSNAEPATASRL